MAGPGYERLTAQDSSFVHFEGAETHMHVSAIAVFAGGALTDEKGALEFDLARRYVESRLAFVPRYRQRLAFTPLQRHPVWVDDDRFDLHHHVRHLSLPRPGSEAQLKDVAGRILSQPLDRDRPLWEMWFVEGLEGGRFAVVVKTHHCLVDGVSGVGLMHAILGMTPEQSFERPERFQPRPAPGLLQLVVDDAARTVGTSVNAVRAVGGALLNPRRATSDLTRTSQALWDTLRHGAHLPAETPLNKPIGTQRRLDWRSFDLLEIKEVKKSLDGTVNDVVLALVTGALRRFLRSRRVKLSELPFRIVVPVNMRGPADESDAANRVSALFLELPVAMRSPRRRFHTIRDESRRLKGSRTAQGIDWLHRALDSSGIDLLSWAGTRLLYALRPHNLVVTNVPGPQFPLYMLGARLLSFTPTLPLLRNQGLGVAAMSYDGRVHIGLIADWDLVPDLETFSEGLETSFAELRVATGAPGGRLPDSAGGAPGR